ncbi:hypothetical protein [Kitasatospora sp. NPDC059327]|uniref:hypothetical protein n=1 Tax=Kitasatospora sp. NPDC059327 TaxID=3346803 RepID=UPI0036A6F5E6
MDDSALPPLPRHHLARALLLGEDLVGWRTALVVALVAAVLLELATAAVRRALRRLPAALPTVLVRPRLTGAAWLRLKSGREGEPARRPAPGPGRPRRLLGAVRFVLALALVLVLVLVLALALGGAGRPALGLTPRRERRR